jgi:hypothetical protein
MTRTNIRALSGVRTHSLSVQAIKAYTSDPAASRQKQSSPATRHGGAWGERRYIFYSFLTSILDGGEWSASHPGRALPPGKGPPVPIVQETGWAPEPVWTEAREEILCPCRELKLDLPVVQSVADTILTELPFEATGTGHKILLGQFGEQDM